MTKGLKVQKGLTFIFFENVQKQNIERQNDECQNVERDKMSNNLLFWKRIILPINFRSPPILPIQRFVHSDILSHRFKKSYSRNNNIHFRNIDSKSLNAITYPTKQNHHLYDDEQRFEMTLSSKSF